VRERKKVEMVVELVEWDDKVEYDRLGVEEQKYTMLDVEVRCSSFRSGPAAT